MVNIGKVFINLTASPSLDEKAPEAYAQQFKSLKLVWDEESYGLERMVRLLLCLSQFCYPILLIRDIFGKWGAIGRKLAVEAYAVFKLLLPLAVLGMGWYSHAWVIFIVVYLLSETIVHMLHLIFLSDIHSVAISYRRALVLLFLQYMEVAFDFAVFYMALDVLSVRLEPITALYFSVVSATTVGFGDIYAKNAAGQMVVMVQLMICVLFIVLFVNHFSQKEN